MIPPQALGQGPSQVEQMLTQQVQQLKQLLQKTMEEYAGSRLKLKGKDEMRDIDIYKAFTERLKVLNDGHMDAREHALAVTQLLHDIQTENLEGTEETIREDEGQPKKEPTQMSFPSEVPPLRGAQKAPNGQWFIKDPMRPGRYMHVLPQQEGGSPVLAPMNGAPQ